ncbi:meiosis-specific protein ASY2-like [Brassica napus]|uniref:meiosis-specific protein ASY2-like n=1 Tax=Brassica napus TaxID=3708 RepID=UPI002078A20C|nr:meiosis-specific protein ASY2-like [Brassica napus]
MSSAQRLSKQQKGKAVAATSNPTRNPDGDRVGDPEAIHRAAMMDTANLSRSQRLLVADAARLAREGSQNVVARDAMECSRDGQSGVMPVDSVTLRARPAEGGPSEDDDSEAEFFPTTFYPDRIFEELPQLHPDLLRPAFLAGQDWEGVEKTKSTPGSVKRVLWAAGAVGVTFLVPTKTQRPWSPPMGYQTVYESYFQEDTRYWFPIPRLITAYARRRDLAISQLLNGSLRLAVTLSVLAEQIDMPMSVRSFEEMTSITDMKDGTYSVMIRPNCNVCAGHPNKTQNWQRSYFFLKSDSSAFEEPPQDDYRVFWNRSCVGHPTSPVYPEDFLRSVRAVALLRIYRWSEISAEKIREWRSDLPTVLPIRAKRLDVFPRDIQKQVTEAKRMGTLPDLTALIAAQLGLNSGEGPSMAVPRADEVFPSDARSAGKGKKRKRGDSSGVERSTEETSDVPPSGEPRKKKKKKRTKKKSAGEQLENADEPIEQEEEDAREEELQSEEGASEAEASEGRNDEEGVSEGEERETSLNAARSGDSEEDSEGSPLLIRMGNDEDDDEKRSFVLTSPRERTHVPAGGGAVQTGTSSRGAAILRRAPRFSFPDKVDFHYEGPAPLVYVPEKCGEFLCQLRGRAKPLPAVKDLIFGGENEEAARAKLLGDSTMNVVIDKYDTALKGALDELELAKKEFAEKKEVSARQLNESRANLQKLNGMMTRTVARRDEFKAAVESSRRIIRELEHKNADLESERASLAATHEGEMKRLRDSRILEVTRERGRVEAK